MNEPEFRFEPLAESLSPSRPSPLPEHTLGIVGRRGADQLFLDHYGLSEQPFGVTPDPRFLYLGAKHRQALDTLSYGTECNRGFLTLIAKPGMGKTSILFQYLEGLRDKARTAFLFQTDCDSTGLLRYLLAELGLDGKGMDLPEMRSVLNRVLLGEMEANRRFVLVIDEAQNLDEKVLESIRLLSNFETPWMKLMQIVLAGQPQLAERLAQPSMAQLRQRVSFAIRLEPFNREEVNLYIDHRLWVAGYKSSPLFSLGARTLIAERSEGIPRAINNLCFCAMSFAMAGKQKTVDRQMMAEVLADLDAGSPVQRTEESPAKLPEEPKPEEMQAVPPIGLTLKPPPPARSWLAGTILIAGFVAFALGWYGLQFRVDKMVGAAFHNISIGWKGAGPSSAPSMPPASAPAVAPNDAPASPKPEPLAGGLDPRPAPRDAAEPAPTNADRPQAP